MSTKKIKSSFFKPRHIEIIKLVKESWVTLFLAVLCLLVVAGSTAVSAYLIKPALDDVFINKDTRMLKLIPLAVIFIYFARGLGMYGQEYLMSRVSQNIIRRLRNRLYDHIQDLSLSFFHKEKTGTLMSRVTNDVTVIKAMVSSLITTSVRDCFTLIGLLFVIFYQIWELA
ncbi:MAG: ABC transporter permease, partial [Proteobacteria bacterium]|nr:ABC transporter permease [Pseudomonadota bacterium]